MAIADDLKAALVTLGAQIDAELAAHSTTADANAAAMVEALATVQALSAKLPPAVPAA